MHDWQPDPMGRALISNISAWFHLLPVALPMCRYCDNLRWVLASLSCSVLKTMSRRGTHGFLRPPMSGLPTKRPLWKDYLFM